MQIYVGITDGDWYQLLSSRDDIDEVNFWQPSGSTQFRALERGELFLFKLHAPLNFIVGGGFFGHFSLLPVSLAWSAFGIKNGVHSLEEMRNRIEHYRSGPANRLEDYTVGCILLEQPFFLSRDLWIPAPPDWKPNIVRGKGYDTEEVVGRRLWDQVMERMPVHAATQSGIAASGGRYGDPIAVRPRLGQGTFRVLVTDAYDRRCAVTRERTLPVLQAAHIRPYADGGEHAVSNGLLLRSDVHLLFDQGYVTVTPEHRFEVSRRIREEFENGRDYYALHGSEVQLPIGRYPPPEPQTLDWHNREVFRG